MKKYLLTLFIALSAAVGGLAVDITPVVNAVKAGNAEALKDKLNATVDVVTPKVSKKSAGGAEAAAILKTFFEANKPTGFTVAHHADKNDSGFFVGKLTTRDGEFRVNITYVVKNEKLLIQIIRIE